MVVPFCVEVLVRIVRQRRGLGFGGLDFARVCVVGTPGFEPGGKRL